MSEDSKSDYQKLVDDGMSELNYYINRSQNPKDVFSRKFPTIRSGNQEDQGVADIFSCFGDLIMVSIVPIMFAIGDIYNSIDRKHLDYERAELRKEILNLHVNLDSLLQEQKKDRQATAKCYQTMLTRSEESNNSIMASNEELVATISSLQNQLKSKLNDNKPDNLVNTSGGAEAVEASSGSGPEVEVDESQRAKTTGKKIVKIKLGKKAEIPDANFKLFQRAHFRPNEFANFDELADFEESENENPPDNDDVKERKKIKKKAKKAKKANSLLTKTPEAPRNDFKSFYALYSDVGDLMSNKKKKKLSKLSKLSKLGDSTAPKGLSSPANPGKSRSKLPAMGSIPGAPGPAPHCPAPQIRQAPQSVETQDPPVPKATPSPGPGPWVSQSTKKSRNQTRKVRKKRETEDTRSKRSCLVFNIAETDIDDDEHSDLTIKVLEVFDELSTVYLNEKGINITADDLQGVRRIITWKGKEALKPVLATFYFQEKYDAVKKVMKYAGIHNKRRKVKYGKYHKANSKDFNLIKDTVVWDSIPKKERDEYQEKKRIRDSELGQSQHERGKELRESYTQVSKLERDNKGKVIPKPRQPTGNGTNGEATIGVKKVVKATKKAMTEEEKRTLREGLDEVTDAEAEVLKALKAKDFMTTLESEQEAAIRKYHEAAIRARVEAEKMEADRNEAEEFLAELLNVAPGVNETVDQPSEKVDREKILENKKNEEAVNVANSEFITPKADQRVNNLDKGIKNLARGISFSDPKKKKSDTRDMFSRAGSSSAGRSPAYYRDGPNRNRKRNAPIEFYKKAMKELSEEGREFLCIEDHESTFASFEKYKTDERKKGVTFLNGTQNDSSEINENGTEASRLIDFGKKIRKAPTPRRSSRPNKGRRQHLRFY